MLYTCLSFPEIDFSLIDEARVFHFGSLSLTDEPSRSATRQAVAYARAKGKLVTYDPNLRPPLWKNLAEAKEQLLWGLGQADVVIYAGSLVNPELLSYCKKECEIHNSAYMTLEEVLAVMEEAEKQKLTTVRLHTGEPSIYGAVREQMDLLDEKGILYESCPGVSACFGAAALLNLEYTLPEVSQSLIITRMEGRTKVPERASIASFAAHHASMAIYLSTGMIGELGRRLIAGGYGKDTPAAIVYKATWPEEEAYLCTVEQLEETAKAHDITKTALIIVGDIVAHQNYGKSRLYAQDFETEFRKIKKSREKE